MIDIFVIKNCTDKSMAMADQACTYWKVCDCSRWAGTKPRRPATYSSFNTSYSTVSCHMDHFSTVTWSEVFRDACCRTDWSKLSFVVICLKQLLNDVIFIWFTVVVSAGCYYDLLLSQQLLPAACRDVSLSSSFFSKIVLQCTGHTSFLTLIFHMVV